MNIQEIARQHQINPEGLSKMDLIRAIQGNEGNVNCFGTSYVDQCSQYECLWREDCQIGVNMNTTTILQYMKKHGQKLDREIAKDTGISLPQVRITIAELQNAKEVSSCNVINFENGVAIEGILCRLSGYIPPAAPGRKATAQTPAIV